MTNQNHVTKYEPADYVKAEFRNEESGETEWMWVRVDSYDDTIQIVFFGSITFLFWTTEKSLSSEKEVGGGEVVRGCIVCKNG
jgi:hypothetical protein